MSCNCQEVAEKGKNKVEESFAKELLKGYSAQAHRWFIAFIVVLILWFSTIGGFIWFLNQYNFESYEYTQDGQGTNNINNNIGGSVYNGADRVIALV
jgi:type IV secretory pathway TrbF-like protein